MDLERLIIQNIQRERIQESLGVEETEVECEPDTNNVLDLLQDYATMYEKGYQNYPEGTAENKAFRDLEGKLVKIGMARKTAATVKNPEMPGSFEDLSKVGKIK